MILPVMIYPIHPDIIFLGFFLWQNCLGPSLERPLNKRPDPYVRPETSCINVLFKLILPNMQPYPQMRPTTASFANFG